MRFLGHIQRKLKDSGNLPGYFSHRVIGRGISMLNVTREIFDISPACFYIEISAADLTSPRRVYISVMVVGVCDSLRMDSI